MPGKQLLNESFSLSPLFVFLNFQAISNFKVKMGTIPWDCDIRDLSDAPVSPGVPMATGHHLELGEWLGTDSPSASRKNQPCRHLDFRPSASRTVREQIYVVLSLPVCGTLFQHP